MAKDEEMHFSGRFAAFEMMKRDLQQRLLLRKTLQEKPEILQVSPGSYSSIPEMPNEDPFIILHNVNQVKVCYKSKSW